MNRFNVGDVVAHSAFVDAGGKSHDRVGGLVVESVKRVDSTCGLPVYYRIKASKPGCRIEAAERFFEADACDNPQRGGPFFRSRNEADAKQEAADISGLVGFCVFDGLFYVGSHAQLEKVGCIDIG